MVNSTLEDISTNVDSIQNGSVIIHGHMSPGEGIAIFAMVVIILLAVVGNVCVLVVILSNRNLRVQLTYIFVVNLCLCDLLAAVSVMPITIVSYSHGTWPMTDATCSTSGFFTSLLMLTSIASVCAISVERFYYIKFPMHYSAHMTLSRSLLLTGFLWTESCFMALLPLLGWNTYTYQPNRTYCSYSYKMTAEHRAYITILSILGFFLPCVIMILMYCGIYRVARCAAKQIYPQPCNMNGENQIHESTTSAPFTIGTGEAHHGNWVPSIAGAMDNVEQDLYSNNISPNALESIDMDRSNIDQARARHRNDDQWKAARTILIIMTLFLFLWGPFFVVNMIGSLVGQVPMSFTLEPITLWMGMTSFAVNPVVYGLLNRAVRGATLDLVDDVKAYMNRNNVEPVETGVDEDFFQFLENTSITPDHSTLQITTVSISASPLPSNEVVGEADST